MLISYDHRQKSSIFQPATLHDLPLKILKKTVEYLSESRRDLVSCTLACRSLHVFARRMLSCKLAVDFRLVGRRICGLRLNSICLPGASSLNIVCLDIQLKGFRVEILHALATHVSPCLYILRINFLGVSRDRGVWILESFFCVCGELRKLELVKFDFGDGYSSETIKRGFGRLSYLSLEQCNGKVHVFISNTPIFMLASLKFKSVYRDITLNDAIIRSISQSYCTFTTLYLSLPLDSSAFFISLIRPLLTLEVLVLKMFGCAPLGLSDLAAIASLPRLQRFLSFLTTVLISCVWLKKAPS